METTNNIRFTANRIGKKGVQYKINIRLNDECKNGHNDFSITGESWEANKPKIDRYSLGCGAMGDTIAKEFPEYAIFNNLHLCDVKGAPMHASANGFYHLKTDKMEKSIFCEYYRVSADQYDILINSEDEQHFKYLLYTIGVVEQWQEEATKAIKLLEEMSGLKFKDDSIRFQLTPFTSEEMEEMEIRISTGYYSQEQKDSRVKKAREEKANAIRNKVLNDFDSKLTALAAERDANLLVLDSELPLNNFIFYSHSLTGSFNWKSWESKITQEQFDQFLEFVKDKTPEGVIWELKEV